MYKDSYYSIVKNFSVNPHDNDAFWFLINGILIIFFRHTLNHFIKLTEKPASAGLGYSFLIMATTEYVLMPLSGFWLFIPQALIIIYTNKESKV